MNQIAEESVNTFHGTRDPDYKLQEIDLHMDAYNANPSSMEIALENFRQIVHKKWLLGSMAELGKYSTEEHKKVLKWRWNAIPRQSFLLEVA